MIFFHRCPEMIFIIIWKHQFLTQNKKSVQFLSEFMKKKFDQISWKNHIQQIRGNI